MPLETASYGREFLIFNRDASHSMVITDSITSNIVGYVNIPETAGGFLLLRIPDHATRQHLRRTP